jgi:undecaprenyl-diphosphatase
MIAPAEIANPAPAPGSDKSLAARLPTPRRHAPVHVGLLAVAVAALLGAIGVGGLVVTHPYMQWDANLERAIQGFNWGPLVVTFPIFSWVGDVKGAVLDAVVFGLILVLNRPAWRLALVIAFTGVLYTGIAHVVVRARPTVAQVLWVTEHPGASSFPSGHTIFIATICALVMLCLGHRYLPKWAVPVGWALAAMIIFAGGVSRIYVGAHWPTDVIAGLFIATAWIAFAVSVRRLSDRAIGR